MNILMLPFEEPLTITVNGEKVSLVAFRTLEHGNIKFGVEAPRSLKVHREEIYQAILQKQAGAPSRDEDA
ncbi:carbon storage regulator [Legionella geestiana]|uniref:carbon storage regulator n=1 Tax=Legionella geestiana TaxID=45065 RepID=UPI0009DCE827|nr:carbon storage regulator [Legionella geestiana]QBS11508.1 carbon storage regulator [Legionella geestiana]QDQ39069.1 carbon storage regulator [Legionella geestiana]